MKPTKDRFYTANNIYKTYKEITPLPHTVCVLIGFILGILYLIGTLDLEYGYYTFLRIFSFVSTAVYLIFLWNDSLLWYCKTPEKRTVIVIIIQVVALILFNPIMPIYLDKDTWVVLDIVFGTLMIILSLILLIPQIKQSISNSLFVDRADFLHIEFIHNRYYLDLESFDHTLYKVEVKNLNRLEYPKKQYGKLTYDFSGKLTSTILQDDKIIYFIKDGRCSIPRRN